MTGAFAIFAFIAMAAAFCFGFFLLLVQPIWSIVDVACSKRLSSGAKTALIVLTLLLLGPLLTFFYALFGTDSRSLRKTTIVTATAFALSLAGVFGMTAIGVALEPGGNTTVTTDAQDIEASGLATVTDTANESR